MYAIEVHGVSKIYRLYAHPKDRLKELLFKTVHHQEFAALSDVSFLVEKGETFGIIGENGAGKSTMLKVLAGTLTPTTGQCVVRGRTSALLELGAGFHPEFTGEENVYLNAALLGLSRKEVERRFDDIASFSELGDFIYRPVRIYSSGMYVRLAFAIATSVDPEVLVIDEALSVGDQYFQKKSIDRLMGFRTEGRTIIFCTHNMYQIKYLCKRALWLKNGSVAAIGDSERVVAAYEAYQVSKSADGGDALPKAAAKNEHYAREVRIESVEVVDRAGSPTDRVRTFDPLTIRLVAEGVAPEVGCHFSVIVTRSDRVNIFLTGTHLDNMPATVVKSGERCVFHLTIPRNTLLAGEYQLCAYATDEHGIRVFDLAEYVCPFFVSYGGREMGISYMEHVWERRE